MRSCEMVPGDPAPFHLVFCGGRMSPNSQTTRSGSELSEVYSGFLVVQLAESAGSADLLRLNSLTDVDELAVLLNKFGVTETQRLIANTSPDQILDLERGIRSKTTGAAPDPSLASFWLIDARHLPDPSDLVTTLRMIAPVRLCYRERKARNPIPVDASDDPLSYTQDHLDAGPVGVNARWAWKRNGGDGSLVHLVDLEQGWHFTHQDLPVLRVLPGVPAAVDVCSRTHGTMVVGVAAALDNDKLIVGVAPNTAWVGIASHYVSGGGDCQNPEVGIVNGRVAQAITRLLLVMPQLLRPGDVLLLEVQSAVYHPIEMEYANFVAIRAATQAGLVVVEAAGNGDLDLDQLADPQSGFNPCDRKRVDWSANGDSGAIFVAAGQPTYSFIIQRSKRL